MGGAGRGVGRAGRRPLLEYTKMKQLLTPAGMHRFVVDVETPAESCRVSPVCCGC